MTIAQPAITLECGMAEAIAEQQTHPLSSAVYTKSISASSSVLPNPMHVDDVFGFHSVVVCLESR